MPTVRRIFSARTDATFYMSGMEHSPTSATGTAWEPTPWRAVQGAAWEAMGKVATSRR
jgi:hypothetical protein